MAFTPFSSKNAKVRSGAGGSTVTAKKWTVEVESDELETSNFEGAGFSDLITGLDRATITVELDLDGQAATTNPWDATSYYWLNGVTVTDLKLYLNGTSGPYWYFPSVKCTKGSNPADVKQTGQATFTFKNKATYTPPSGAFSS